MNTVPILIAYEKEINTRAHARQPSKTVRGNALLMVSEQTVDFFNIPTYNAHTPLIQNVKSYSREINKSKVKIKEYERLKRGYGKGRTVRLLPKLKIKRASFLITFPHFFNISMIRDSLFLLLAKHKSQCRFQPLPSQKKCDIFIGNTVRVWIPKKLIEARNTEYTDWGSVCFVNPFASPKTLKIKNI
jgi:hypothetical protein